MVLLWTYILLSTNFLAWTAVGAQVVEHGITKLKRQLLEDRLNRRPSAPSSRIIQNQLSNLQGHYPRLLTQSQQTGDFLSCNPEGVVLNDFQQWKDETGYWIGDYDFYQSNGEPYKSSQWPFPYRQYRGFITGNVVGNKYRQRNVFVYRPLPVEECDGYDSNITNTFHGTCGTNGSTKLFEADQEVTNCGDSTDGSISGPYKGVFKTETDLVGNDDAILYRVTLNKDALGPGFPPKDCLLQNQLTTITRSSDGEQVYRSRSAQSFECFNPVTYGQPNSLSFYRERKVDQEEFVTEMKATLTEFNVTKGDMCAWEPDAASRTVPSIYYDNPGVSSCLVHLNESFALKRDSANVTEQLGSSGEIEEETVQRSAASEQSTAVLQAVLGSSLLLFAQCVVAILLVGV